MQEGFSIAKFLLNLQKSLFLGLGTGLAYLGFSCSSNWQGYHLYHLVIYPLTDAHILYFIAK